MSTLPVKLATSTRLADRDRFITSGSLRNTITDVVAYNELLALETYVKLVCYSNGRTGLTSAPTLLAFCCNDWHWFRLSSGVCIAHRPPGTAKLHLNEWWAVQRDGDQAVPHMYGDLVVFRWAATIRATDIEGFSKSLRTHYNFLK